MTRLPISALERFVAELAARPDHWHHLVRHSDDGRVHEQIWDDERVNAWLICWSAEQDTGYHDHDVSAAAIAVISGSVREDRLRLGGAASTRVVSAGGLFTVAPEAIHRVLHAGAAPAVSIHAYSPPLLRMGTYRTAQDGTLQRTAKGPEYSLREPVLI